MADTDGMLLNISLGDGPIHAGPSLKGGKWRDRLQARTGSRQRPPPTALPSANVTQPPISDDGPERARKRIRVESAVSSSHDMSAKHSGTRHGPTTHQSRSLPKERNGEVISSLFSFNPASRTVSDKDGREEGTGAPSNAPLPDGISSFSNLGLSTSLSAHLLTKMKLKNPTSIQKATISQLIKDDSDAFVQAETGSGKTLAYLLPIVQRIMDISRQPHETAVDGDGRLHRDSGLFAIILAPTRELCKQISVVLESVLRCAHWIVAGTVIGGEKKKSEKARLRKGLNILVATPGRLADHLDHTKVLDVSRVRWLVLDEGDRLMELGFEEELQGIVAKLGQRSRFSRLPHHPESPLPDRRVTVLCSATLKLNVQRLGEISLKDAVHLKADPSEETSEGARSGGDSDDNFTAPLQLKQSYAVVPAKLRLVTLVAVLRRAFYRRGSVTKAVVFISCADSVDFHFELFTRPASQEGSTATATATTATTSPAPALSSPENLVTLHRLHGSLTQPVRTSTLSAFKNSKTASVLICTDVASRGLDLPNVDLVVEYDPPFNPDDHLHRVGRTARAGRDGRAIIFLMPGDEEGYVSVLHHRHQREGGPSGVARHDSPELLKKGFGSTGPGGGRDWDERATEWQLDAERWALDHPRYLEMARRAFQSHVRAYATHVASERAMFSIKSLHLGHLAKSFALREKPGSIQGPSQRTKGDSKGGTQRAGGGVRGGTHVTATATPSQRRDSRGGDRTALGAASTTADADAAAKKMRAKMKEHMSSISEFNIG